MLIPLLLATATAPVTATTANATATEIDIEIHTEAFVREFPQKLKAEDVKTKLSCETFL